MAGKAEDVFRSLRYYVPSSFDLRTSEVVGVLDPPRAGMHEKVIRSCREVIYFKFVSILSAFCLSECVNHILVLVTVLEKKSVFSL